VDTGIEPPIELGNNGKVDWIKILTFQAESMERNEMIIRLLRFFSKRVILVLCKRVNQANYLYEKLKELNEDVTSLIGAQKKYEQTSRILIATCQKAGVGFDHPRLDSILLAGDIKEYFIQYLGRCFRTEKGKPVIIDMVDNNFILKRHFQERQQIYYEHGGNIRNFNKHFPEFI
jgi:superfamily II DNA or RNA helicase